MSENNHKIVLLDGGLGQEINKRSSHDASHPLWSVEVMHSEPEIVVDVHSDFLKAGARTISTNNYTASLTRLERHGALDRFRETHQLAIDLANQAIENSDIARDAVTIAGCLMPLAASYVAEAAHGYDRSYDEYCQVTEAQIHGVDMFLVETISNVEEARAACNALKSFGQNAYIGLTLSDDCSNKLRSGESLEQAVEVLIGAGATGLMVNCSFPEAVDKAMPILASSGLTCGGYANGFTSIETLAPGTTVDSLSARKDLSPEAYTNHATRWVNDGATIIGGCCEIGPDHIRHMHETLTQAGYEIDKLRP